MSRRTKKVAAAAGMVTLAIAFMVGTTARIDSSPLRAGSTADEAWTYIHTNSVAYAPAKSSPWVDKRSTWRAAARNIQHDTCLYWRTNHLFATRTRTYIVGTNSVIASVSSHWSFKWPF